MVQEEEDGELQWVFDNESAGDSIQVENLALTSVLVDEQTDPNSVQWEFRSENSFEPWEMLSEDMSAGIELQFAAGKMFNNSSMYCSVDENRCRVYFKKDKVKITAYTLTELKGTIYGPAAGPSSSRQIEYRRYGRRMPMPTKNEDRYLDTHQKQYDNYYKNQYAREDIQIARMLKERKGRDVEGIRGTMGIPPRSGTHSWTLKWHHEPEKVGAGDGVGLCDEDTEEFGPSAPPLFGGSTGVASIALYANVCFQLALHVFIVSCVWLCRVNYTTTTNALPRQATCARCLKYSTLSKRFSKKPQRQLRRQLMQ